MAKRELKSSRKKSVTQKPVENESQDLYVCVIDVINKRKSLLTALKTTLLAQEECEQVSNLRKERYHEIDLIKKELAKINSAYVKLQKLFPNVKGIISHAENEINELHEQITVLTKTKQIDELELKELETLEKSVTDIDEKLIDKKLTPKVKKINEKTKETSKSQPIVKKPVNKLDRIKNNLSIIEEKLKEL